MKSVTKDHLRHQVWVRVVVRRDRVIWELSDGYQMFFVRHIAGAGVDFLHMASSKSPQFLPPLPQWMIVIDCHLGRILRRDRCDRFAELGWMAVLKCHDV